MPSSARGLLASLSCCFSQGLRLDDASVLAQSTFLLRRDRQAHLQQPFYPQSVPQLIPQQPQPYYPSTPGYYPMQPQQQPYFPGQQPLPVPMPYYPGSAPYYPQPMPYYSGQPQYQPTQPTQPTQPHQPLQASPPRPQQAPGTPPGQPPAQPYQAPPPSLQSRPTAKPAETTQKPMGWWTTPMPIVPTLHDTVDIKIIPKTAFERHPKIYNLFHLVPNTRTHCLQGQKDYLLVALARLKQSPVSSQWGNSTVAEGSCSDLVYNKGPDYHRCFPQAVLYHPFAMTRQQYVMPLELNRDYLRSTQSKLVATQKAWKDYVQARTQEDLMQDEEEVLAICDNGRLLEETFGMPIAAASFALKPASGRYCLQGSMSYLQNVLAQLNETEEFRDAEVEEGACMLHSFKRGPREPRCLPHASLYLNTAEANETEERVAAAEEDLQSACLNATLVSNVTSFLRSKQSRADRREQRLKADAEEAAASNFHMFDEKLYACWQGSQKRLEKVRDYFRGYGMPEWFFERRMKIYSGGCDSMCMVNGWVERRSCIRHMRQCRHPDIEDLDHFLKKKDSLVPILANATRATVDEMIDGSDLELSCGPVKRKKKGGGMWAAIQKEIDLAMRAGPMDTAETLAEGFHETLKDRIEP